MPSVHQHIEDNASHHAHLLRLLSELDYVPAAISNQTAYVSDLEAQVASNTEELKKLAAKTQKERKEHESLQKSTARRLAHKLTGRKQKFEAKATKEEKEFVEALQHEMTKQDSQMTLRQLLEEAKSVQTELRIKGDQHDKAKKDLADLYNSIFTGPTQEFPEEDERENQVQAAQIYHDQVQAAINRESQAAEILARADETMASCESKMRDALGYSQWDMWGGGNVSDMLERSALGNAQSFAFQAQVLVEQARRISQLVQPIGPVNIAQGSILTDVFFDNIFTDMAFHDKIKRSADEVGQARSRIREECENANQRTEAIGRDLLAAVENLKRCRNELDSSRRAAFESITGRSNTPSSLPPAYEAASALSMPEPAKPADPLKDVSAHWGNRNPYAAALAQRSKSSIEEPRAGSS